MIAADFAREYEDPARLGANASVRTFGDEYATTWTEDVGQGGVELKGLLVFRDLQRT